MPNKRQRPSVRVLDETLIRVADARECRRIHGEPKVRTVLRWIDEGLKSVVTREQVHLEYAKMAGARVTSLEAVRRFNMRLNGEDV